MIGPGAGNKLLVFGAGAAGMNLAIQAAKLGVSVDVLEKLDVPFASLRLASWRRIDPVEYDWPHDHYARGTFSATGSVPLPQTTGTGAYLANVWDAAWQKWAATLNGKGNRGKVEIIPNFDATQIRGSFDEKATGVTVDAPWPGSAAARVTYGAIVSCVGFAGEKTDDPARPWNDYAGPQFWTDDDHFHEDLARPLECHRVLISGGGDGGMQDYQRAMTGSFGKALLKRITDFIAPLDRDWQVLPATSEAMILKAEDAGRRACAWRQGTHGIDGVLADWHAAFEKEADKVLGSLDESVLRQLELEILRPCIVSGATRVTWIYRDATPGYAYALNRYLSIFVERMAEAAAKSSEALPRREIISIVPDDPANHQCGNPDDCFGVEHHVVLRSAAGVDTKSSFDWIVVRHGANQIPLLREPTMPEQMTPYDIPR